jgi:hypothetical protein
VCVFASLCLPICFSHVLNSCSTLQTLYLSDPPSSSSITFRLLSSFSFSRFISVIIQCSFHLSLFCYLLLSTFIYFLPIFFLRISLPSYFLYPFFLLIIHTFHFTLFSSFLIPFPACFTFPFRFFSFSLPFFLKFLPSSRYITFSFLPPVTFQPRLFSPITNALLQSVRTVAEGRYTL